MNKRGIYLLAFVLLLGLAIVAEAEAQTARDAVRTFTSGKPFEIIGKFLKEKVFLWYTTNGGELNPQYKNHRRIVDSIIFFVLFMSIFWISVSKVFKDATKGSKLGIALPLALIATISLVIVGNFSIGNLLQFSKILAFLLVTFVFYLILGKLLGDKYKLLSLLLAIGLSWLALNSLDLLSGDIPSPLDIFTSKTNLGLSCKDDFVAEINSQHQMFVAVGDNEARLKAIDLSYRQALCYVENNDYANAATYLEKVISYGPNDNPKYDQASKWIQTKLVDYMSKNVPALMKAEIEAGKLLITLAKQKPANDPDRKEMLERSQAYLRHAISTGKQFQQFAKK